MKTTITCPTCGHEVQMEEDSRIKFDTGLVHRPDGGHEYVVSVATGLTLREFTNA